MKGLLDVFNQNKELSSLYKGIQGGVSELLLTGLTGSSKAIFAQTLFQQKKESLLIVTHNLYHAQKMYEDMIGLMGEQQVWLYPVNDLLASEMGVASPELKAARIEVLNRLVNGQKGVYIVPIVALRKFMPSPRAWKKAQMTIEIGEEVDLEQLTYTLVKTGYTRREMIESPGDFCLRGGILDLYPLTEENPLRIEFFDTEVDSIRTFSLETQRSIQKQTVVQFGPATEYLLTDEQWDEGVRNLEKQLAYSLNRMTRERIRTELSEQVNYELERLRDKQIIEQMFKYSSLFFGEESSFLDFFSKDTLVVFDEMVRIFETYENLDHEDGEWITNMLESASLPHDIKLAHTFSEMLKRCPQKLYMNLFLRQVHGTHPTITVNVNSKSVQEFFGQMNLLKTEQERWEKAKYTVIFLAENEERIKKLQPILEDYDIRATYKQNTEMLLPGNTYIVLGHLATGFELSTSRLVVLTEKELFNKKVKKPQKRQKLSNAERIKSYQELRVGDYVVHVNHGIGKFLGINTLEINGVHKDYLHIEYQENDKLYVPIEQIDQVQKYVGSEGKEPKLYKLGGSEWKKVKRKVERSVQDIADDLIKLYAEREAARGYAFSTDTVMQQDFESAFGYQETDDQIRSIQEIKKDMESEKPMDRLLCGDVGYGKTEVAIRAAFKAVMDGKQVALLVPTTILAQQHYNTIRERFQDFDINIGLLSRFRTRKQQTETIKGLKDGTVQVVIGTHRLLSKEIAYHDLGLLIIDEEQRFGVSHKEKIKQLKANIDVLTLTATPIPRTLHMSMLGVRDLSVIETPPENRFPVQTYVLEYSEALIREAIEREMSRDGQVFFLYNRVEDIERKAEEISMLVPDARVTFAHGRMNENELESVMLSFLDGQYDVLVSTTIIETGVDIPNVNTLIVSNADKMGLSQLYQLRGRVGRSNRVAYAYFTYQRDKVLNEVAEKRLQSMKEFTELGSGFKIAMRDLSIRGAGNLLGAQQHGFIDSVGFDLYSQMLKDAVAQKRGIPDRSAQQEIEIDVEVDAYLPDMYISDSKQKIEMYKKFQMVSNEDEIIQLQEEMMDRFGDFPREVGYLFQLTLLKTLANTLGIARIKQIKNEIVFLFTPESTKNIAGEKVFAIVSEFGRSVWPGQETGCLKLTIATKGKDVTEWMTIAENLLRKMRFAQKGVLETQVNS